VSVGAALRVHSTWLGRAAVLFIRDTVSIGVRRGASTMNSLPRDIRTHVLSVGNPITVPIKNLLRTHGAAISLIRSPKVWASIVQIRDAVAVPVCLWTTIFILAPVHLFRLIWAEVLTVDEAVIVSISFASFGT
jgi:hypothetical protein